MTITTLNGQYIGGSSTTPLKDQLAAAIQSGIAVGTGQSPSAATWPVKQPGVSQ